MKKKPWVLRGRAVKRKTVVPPVLECTRVRSLPENTLSIYTICPILFCVHLLSNHQYMWMSTIWVSTTIIRRCTLDKISDLVPLKDRAWSKKWVKMAVYSLCLCTNLSGILLWGMDCVPQTFRHTGDVPLMLFKFNSCYQQDILETLSLENANAISIKVLIHPHKLH